MRIKVLPLEYWMDSPDMLEDAREHGRYVEINPLFGRPAIFLQGDDCWFETSEGKAYLYDKKDFRWNLAMANALELTDGQHTALQAVVKHKLATKKQRELLYHRRCALECRETYRNACKARLRMFRD